MLLEIAYIGESLVPGNVGHFAVLLNFTAALFAAVAYYFSFKRPQESGWLAMGRLGFGLHSLSVFTIIGVLFGIMVNKFYEYKYVFDHVNEDLPFQYIFSAFWEGQEGSFLLWMFWHVILGLILMRTAGKWESPVLALVSLVQAFIASMLLGIYVEWGEMAFKIGSNPFVLLRDVTEGPIFNNADYLSLIKGSGLNPLLQNYWMIIHPPTLFMGFASTVVPMGFALAGLFSGDHRGWLRPALSWSLFSAAILGTGILMGGAWAYEALSFGGYWAWDPVENMSLAPWLVLLAGLHTNLIARSTGHSIRTTYLLYPLSFSLVLYSTFLTRSGVLGETSVHAFTQMGLEWQLILFLATFFLLGTIPVIARWKKIPASEKEEATSSREFWMFIGSLILLFSGFMITASTSLPVYNKIVQLFDPLYEGQVITDPVAHYNKYQLWVGVFIGLLSGVAQLLRWKEPNWASYRWRFFRHLAISTAIAGGLTGLLALWINLYSWQYAVLLFFGVFTLVSNLDYILVFLRGNLKSAGSALSHIGFGIMIVGILASGLNKHHISTNPFAQRGLIDEERLDRNIMVFKEMPMFMSGYKVTYQRDSFDFNNRIYQIDFEKIGLEGEVEEAFSLYPTALYDNQMAKVAAYNPSTKHYLHKDVFTHIASIPLSEADAEYARDFEDSLEYKYLEALAGQRALWSDTIPVRDTSVVRHYEIEVTGTTDQPVHPDYEPMPGDLAVGLQLQVYDPQRDTSYRAEPALALREGLLYTFPVHIQPAALQVRLTDAMLNRMFTPEEELDYQTHLFKIGETKSIEGTSIQFNGFVRSPSHPEYDEQEGDIAVGASLEVKADGKTYSTEPLFFIRESTPFNLKSEIRELGLHFRFVRIDPVAETMELLVARETAKSQSPYPFEAAYSPRTDFLVLEVIVFPGINLFWIGTILMMVGMVFAMINRIRSHAA